MTVDRTQQMHATWRKYSLVPRIRRRPTYRARMLAALEKLESLSETGASGWIQIGRLNDQIEDDATRLGEKLGPKAMACIFREIRKAVASGFVELNEYDDSIRVRDVTRERFRFFRDQVEDDIDDKELVLRDLLAQGVTEIPIGKFKPFTNLQYRKALEQIGHYFPEVALGPRPYGSNHFSSTGVQTDVLFTIPVANANATPLRRQTTMGSSRDAYPTPESAPRRHRDAGSFGAAPSSPSPLSRTASFVCAFGGDGCGDDNDDDDDDTMDVECAPPAADVRLPGRALVKDPSINVAPQPQEAAGQAQQSEVPPLAGAGGEPHPDADKFEHRHRWFSVSLQFLNNLYLKKGMENEALQRQLQTTMEERDKKAEQVTDRAKEVARLVEELDQARNSAQAFEGRIEELDAVRVEHELCAQRISGLEAYASTLRGAIRAAYANLTAPLNITPPVI